MKSILYVGLDVDDTAFHGGVYCRETGETFEFKCKPNKGSLMSKLQKFIDQGYELKVCYESTHICFGLCRNLNKEEHITCEIIAPSLIPSLPGKKVKTDRLDANKLAEYYAKGMLTSIYIPDEKDEEVRKMIRTRGFLVRQRKNLKRYILSSCREFEIDYKSESNNKEYWTKKHIEWLTSKIKELPYGLNRIFEILLYELDKLSEGIKELEELIEKEAESKRYKKRKDALVCFRGLSTLSSMSLITEIGDIKRFSHPNHLSSYCGLNIREYSSGGKEKKGSITKMGNKWIRTTAIEACQNIQRASTISKRLKAMRKGQDLKIISVAEKCTKRLRKKALRMIMSGKHINKVKVACARELLGFVWETLNLVA